MLETIIVAFSMFSILPLPTVTWNDKNTKYMLLGFPLVGVFIGVCFLLLCELLHFFQFSDFFQGISLLILPILISGGIHLDGYCDTYDGIASHKSKEEKLQILSDPHVGVFAVLRLSCYLLLFSSVLYELELTRPIYTAIFTIFPLSRSISALMMVRIPSAKRTGLAHTFTETASLSRVQYGLISYLILLFSLLFLDNPLHCVLFMVTSILVVFHWYISIIKAFQGITGDLSGCLTQKLEFYFFFALLFAQKVGVL